MELKLTPFFLSSSPQALFNFYSHTTQDTYTTMLLTTKSFNNAQASRASILMKTGACVGGTIIGWLSQSFGRRRSIFVAALISACLIPAWVLPNTESGLSASGFMLQFFVQGAWGVIPVVSRRQRPHPFPSSTGADLLVSLCSLSKHLTELAPPMFRASFPGYVLWQRGACSFSSYVSLI